MSEHSVLFDEWDRKAKSLSVAELLRRDEIKVRPRFVAKRQSDFIQNVLFDVRAILADEGDEGSEGTFEMANVRPDKSGLPFIVFISEKGRARHDVRVKVGTNARDFVATVSVRPDVQLLAGELSGADLALLRAWIELNRDVIVRYWDGDIVYTEDALAALKALPKEKLEASLRIVRAQDEVTAAMERADIAYRARAYRVAYRHLKRALAHLDTLITNESRSDAP